MLIFITSKYLVDIYKKYVYLLFINFFINKLSIVKIYKNQHFLLYYLKNTLTRSLFLLFLIKNLKLIFH